MTVVLNSETFAKEDTKEEIKEETSQQYSPENVRARLADVRKCFKENPGNSWSECRYKCADVCNQILETYARGVCNGVLIQLCCGQHPSECK